jgi:hypothetical protein
MAWFASGTLTIAKVTTTIIHAIRITKTAMYTSKTLIDIITFTANGVELKACLTTAEVASMSIDTCRVKMRT